MLWLVLRRTLVLTGCALLAIAISIGAMLLRDRHFAHVFTSAHSGPEGEPVTYHTVLFFFSPSWQTSLLMLGILLGPCLLIALLWTLIKRGH